MPSDFLKLVPEERREALAVASTQSGRPAHLLEKDVWAVWTLRQLYASPYAEHLIFKGGTSLSKRCL
jgi:predicted nucleotidyltransferase component of viral defense system